MTREHRVPDASHPITVAPTPGRVRVTVGDEVVADTTAALTLEEAGYPPVQYVPLAAVDPALLRRSDTTTWCPYKGEATYHDLTAASGTATDAVWSYADPFEAVAEIRGHVAFVPGTVEVRTGTEVTG